MTDPMTMIETLRRPRLLVSAARLGQTEFVRSRRLRRILARPQLPACSREVTLKLLDMENDIDIARRSRDAGYSATLHVEILTALLNEALVLKAQRLASRSAEGQLNASATSILRRVI